MAFLEEIHHVIGVDVTVLACLVGFSREVWQAKRSLVSVEAPMQIDDHVIDKLRSAVDLVRAIHTGGRDALCHHAMLRHAPMTTSNL